MVQKSTMQWDDIRLFLALARGGSARAAAAALGISHTTIARRAERLETGLGTRLFDRDVGGYRLTGAGEALMSNALQAEETLLAAERQLQGQDASLSGTVRLTAPDLFATHLIMDSLAEFTHRYPDIDLHVYVSYDVFDLARREADVAIRIIGKGRSPPEDLVGRKLGNSASCYYATEAYLAVHDPWDKSGGARYIGWGDEERFPQWVRESLFPHVPAVGVMNNAILQVEAAKHGMGIAVLPCFLGDSAQGLVRVPGSRPYANYDIWLLSHPDLRDAARLRTFRQFIAEAFEKKKGLLAGVS